MLWIIHTERPGGRFSPRMPGSAVRQRLNRNAELFTSAHDYQPKVVVECCRGESKRYEENEPLGTIVLDNLPREVRGKLQIEVTFRVDTDGILHVRACDKNTGAKQEISLNVIGTSTGETASDPSPDAPAVA